MNQISKISSKEALLLIEQVVVEAEKINKQVAVAVCGPTLQHAIENLQGRWAKV
jgi:hypothetical protein